MPVIVGFLRRIDAGNGGKRLHRTVFGRRLHGHLAVIGQTVRQQGIDPFDPEHLLTGQAQRRRSFANFELERQNAHADQVRAVDALVAFRQHRPHAEQHRPFGRPIAR